MLHDSPLRDRHAAWAADQAARVPAVAAQDRPGAATGHRLAVEVAYLPYATPEGVPVCELPEDFGPIEPEYAAIRRGAALFDAAQRGLILVRGADGPAFLQRMVTQDVSALTPGRSVAGFRLNRKGRIDADLLLVRLEAEGAVPLSVSLCVDAGKAAETASALSGFVFNEDVGIEDASASWHWLELHGPAAGRMLALAGAERIPGRGEACLAALGGVPTLVVRADLLGETGWLLGLPREQTATVWDALIDLRDPLDPKRRVRPIGWNAYNIARVEAGTPFFQIDFGTSNLPHETGLVRERVSFRKGCYLGQEIVARMESLGRPKQVLVGLRPSRDLLPVAGSQVFERTADGAMGPAIGLVTSSTLAPMLGAAPIAFAMIKSTCAEMGTTVLVNAEGEQCEAAIAPLRSWPQEPTP